MREYKMRTFLLKPAQFPRSVILTGVGRNRENMWFLLFLLAVPCVAGHDWPPDECFDQTKYIGCSEIIGRPDACDCSGMPECYIKLTITRLFSRNRTTRNSNKTKPEFKYLVNGRSPGPTIIADYQAYVVVDVYNEMPEDTSVHHHGMHQVNVAWIDGVGNLTQYPIPPYGRFRYIFQAYPSGTHWYHSHMRLQRDFGLFGMLIIHEPESDIHNKLGEFIDDPKRKSLAILDDMKSPSPDRGNKRAKYCLPDGSRAPADFRSLKFILNGVNLVRKAAFGSQSISTNDTRLLFFVAPGKRYRFRILGAMEANMVMISIDQHKLKVIATDGFLVEPFETDFVIMHVAERYDFILDAKPDVEPGTRFQINFQSLAGLCKDNSKTAAKTFAYIVYLDPPLDRLEFPEILPTPPPAPLPRCTKDRRCKILNCPFKIMPPIYNSGTGEFMDCHDVSALKLLYPTIPAYVPRFNDISPTSFFNFRKYNGIAVINGVVLTLPEIPVLENSNHNYECKYPVDCKVPLRKKCTHAVRINKFENTVRFVLSAIDPNNALSVTHPIHMHGHSFFVSKIGYPTYNSTTGTIIRNNSDVHVPECGAGNWSDGPPKDISVNSRTVRKDVITIPAGGYVVIEFIADNPGYWFMHCHIDFHLLEGMAIIISEVPKRASTPPDALNSDTKNFCFSVGTFIEKQSEINALVRAPHES